MKSTAAMLALVSVVAAAALAVGAGATDASRSIDRHLDELLPAGASGTLVAAADGERVACRGFGLADRARRTPARCDTVYDVMSMTKQFTAAAILKLEMMGRLAVSDPISAYVEVPAGKREITVHHLLTHTAGLPGAIGGDYERLSRRRMLREALSSELRSRPGTRYHYSNVGYSVLAAIVEIASGLGYEEFLTEHLFRPAGMTQTGYVLPDWKRRRVAIEYDARGRPRGRPFDHPWAADGPYWNLRGNGGMLSTARDMLRWHLALEGDAVLDEASKRRLFHPYVREGPGADTHYGYGWVIDRRPNLGRFAWHDGGNGWSFGIVTRLLEEDAMVFWVTNRYRNDRRGWDLTRLASRLTVGVLERALAHR